MTRPYRTLDNAEVAGRRVLLRVDLNVPMERGRVTDATRIERVVPTVRELAEKGARVLLLAHFGRPKGGPDKANSLAPLAPVLAEALGRPVAFAADCIGPVAQAAVAKLLDGEVLLLENTRFHSGEEANSGAFIDELAGLGDLYVNDAFSAAHRAHASTEGLARRLPAYAGRAMQAELAALALALDVPKHPVCAVVGGAKVSTKLDLLGNLVGRVQVLVIGGGMANTFLHAQGVAVGKSLCEKDLAETAREILLRADAASCRIVLPIDAVVAREFKSGAAAEIVGLDAVPADAMILDLGPASVGRVAEAIDEAATVVWNGPLGAFELEGFEVGTVAVARRVAERTAEGGLVSVAGGGDTVAALNRAGVAATFTYLSTAGGAFLEWLEGKALPGVEALRAG